MLKGIISGVIGNFVYSSLIKFINLFRPHTKSVFEKVLGRWIGHTVQTTDVSGKDVIVDLKVDFHWTISGIGGKAIVTGRGEPVCVKIKGNINKANYFVLEYFNTDNLTNFGNMILSLNSNGDKLQGVLIGFGNVSDKFIYGRTELKRS